MTAYRFMCRRPGERWWEVYLGLTAFNTAEGAARLVAEWNREYRGRREWTCQEALPTDIDYPGNWERWQKRERRRQRLVRRDKMVLDRAAKQDAAVLASVGLKL